MEPTRPIADPASTPKTGLFAIVCGFLHVRGSGASGRALNSTATLATISATLLAGAGLTAAVPATASAYATIEGPPIFSSASGLPDGRVYEQVSPPNKDGNQAGAGTDEQSNGPGTGQERYALAAPDGDSVLFEGTGPMGETAAAYNTYFVATRSSGGWSTRSVMPSAQQSGAELGGTAGVSASLLDPSSDLSHVMYTRRAGTWALDMPNFEECGRQPYLSGPDPFVPATWLGRPEISDPLVNCQSTRAGEPFFTEDGEPPIGGTPDFSTVYFVFRRPLLPEDASRRDGGGFYEYSESTLHEAGVLPDGSLSPFGATSAGIPTYDLDPNAVSANGRRAFFVSPEPGSCTTNGGQNNCAVDPPELYVRETEGEGSEADHKTVLVSQDTLLPSLGGLPAPAPADPEGSAASFALASPDGSQAFFQSTDDLTKTAENDSPGPEPKTYDFDVNTGELTYLPDVAGEIVASDTEGTSFAFVRPEAGGAPAEIDLWSAGPAGGSVTPVAQLPGPPSTAVRTAREAPPVYVSEARLSSVGSELVFVTATPIAGFNDGGIHIEGNVEIPNQQIYRYDASSNTLGCASCPPHGVKPTGSATLDSASPFNQQGLVESRGMSADGDRIFFDTPEPLVPQATNAGSTDVYEWENGVVYLISSGKSTRNSYFLDNSETGDDVFFATTDGLVPGDTDGAYDVYDARVHRPGDNPPPAAVPCEGSVCQGPPRVESSLAPPARATFAGSDNLVPEPIPAATVTKKTTTKTVKCKKGFVKKKNKCVKIEGKQKAQKSTHSKGGK